MADLEHLKILKRGVKEWNRWREVNPNVKPGLSEAQLKGVDLKGADLKGANLNEAQLKGANLSGADLRGAYLRRVSFSNANIGGADLKGAFLSEADLREAKLCEASLWGAYLSGADLGGANLGGTDFTAANLHFVDLTGADLTGADFSTSGLAATHLLNLSLGVARGLEEMIHAGPSFIDTKTLEMSKGKISDVFLRGCGLSDWEILGAKLHDPDLRQDEIIDLTYKIAEVRGSSPIVPLSVFLSYSHEDTEFVDLVSERLDDDGIRSWRDTHDMVAGPLEPQIDTAISAQRAVLLVLSENSVTSEWVPWELDRARRAEEAAGGYKICPVALDDAWLDCGWPDRVRTYLKSRYYVLPLHDWQDEEAFEPQYQKLKKGLGIYYRDEGE